MTQQQSPAPARRAPAVCTACEDQPAIIRVSATTLDGSVLDTAILCRDCYTRATLIGTLTIGDPISSPRNDEPDPRD